MPERWCFRYAGLVAALLGFCLYANTLGNDFCLDDHSAIKENYLVKGGIGNIQYPLVQDLNKAIAQSYGILLNDSVALRGLYLIDPTGTVRHCIINDLPLGRNVDEALRMVDAVQFSDTHGEVCPANWKPGAKAMVPNAEGLVNYFH